MSKRVQAVRRLSYLCTAILLALAFYFLILPHTLFHQSDDQKLDSLQWPERLGRLRQRSNYHEWRGSSSEWMKRSLLGRFLFVFSDEQADANRTEAVRQTLQALAKQPWPDPLNFVTVSKPEYMSSFNNIVGEDFLHQGWPGALILDVAGGFKKYHVPMEDILKLEGAALDEALSVFFKSEVLDKYFQHSLQPYLRNEMIEVDNYEGVDHLKHINSTYFHQVLLKNHAEQEFMIIFYAPWCGHCRRFESAFTPLAAHVRRATKRIGFYKMDATKNDIDHPEIHLLRVPYIRFFTARDNFKHPISFDHRTESLELGLLKRFFSDHSEFSQEVNKISAEEL